MAFISSLFDVPRNRKNGENTGSRSIQNLDLETFLENNILSQCSIIMQPIKPLQAASICFNFASIFGFNFFNKAIIEYYVVVSYFSRNENIYAK